MSATIAEQLERIKKPNYIWKKELLFCDTNLYQKCKCFDGFCTSTRNGIFVQCCKNEATVGDYLRQKSNANE